MQEDLSWPIFRTIDENVRATLSRGSPGGILIFSEHMDRMYFPDPVIQARREEWVKKKYANSRLDLVIEVGDFPRDLFPNVPLVYLSPTPQQSWPIPLAPRENDAGIWVELGAGKTLEAARRIQPNARQVVVIGGSSSTEKMLLDQVRDQIASSASPLQIVYLTNLGFAAISKRVEALGPESIVLFVSMARDAEGRSFVSADVIGKIAAISGAPVYVLFDTHVGTGAIGGYAIRFGETGKQAGEMGLQVLAGEHPNDALGRSDYVFDWRQLQRWKIPESLLPVGSMIVNRQVSNWETYRWYIIGAAIVSLLEALLILGLLWQWARKRKFKKSLYEQMAFDKMLSELSTKFINLPEEQVQRVIGRSLSRIAKLLELDRITLFEYAPNTEELRIKSAWCEEGIPDVPGVIQFKKFPLWGKRLVEGETVLVPDVGALPEEAQTEKEFCMGLGTRSAAIVPLEGGEELLGAISFASTKQKRVWTEEVTEHLRLMAEIFANAMMRTHAEQVVRESEDRFRLVANSAPVLIWMSGTDKLCNFFNQSWLKFTGRTFEEELGDGWTLGVHPDERARCMQVYSSAFDARLDFQLEYRLRRFDGEYRWIVDFGVPRFESDGTFRGYIGSCVDITQRKKSEESLHTLTGRLIGAQEEERARIARELHDDFSQRLALLGIELGQLWKKLPAAEVEQRASVEMMLNETKEMSSDLHSLSHQLHSSKLDLVGLVPALKGLCKEISHKYMVEIDFTEREGPRNIPKDTALCLFRVAQEALANIVKHSRSKEARVEFLGKSSGATLRIMDNGVGFDMGVQKSGAGIGIIGMSERLRLVGGRLSIRSEPNRGTEIIAEVPLVVPTKEAAASTQAAGR
jgi:PAS domain S-box-containing protein